MIVDASDKWGLPNRDEGSRGDACARLFVNFKGSTLLGSSVLGIFSAKVEDIPKLAEAIAKARAA
jgi:hypothetical protein